MRAGHRSFEYDSEGQEVPVLSTNLMHGDNTARLRADGQDLTDGQYDRMLSHGARYLS